ncbi:MAG TPA: hypothetical protein VLK82_17885 [Candidatus Tectomicrobia bacterium]|nr:hypothetical protein [Candidatus Tectomicrobia bacterium]
MTLALQRLPIPVLGLLVVGLPVLLAVVGLLLVRARVPHPRLQPHHDVAGYIYSGLAVLYAVLLAFVVIAVWGQFDATRSRVQIEADALGDLVRQAEVFPLPVQRAIFDAVRTYAKSVVEDEWPTMARGAESPLTRQAYTHLWQTMRNVEPRTPTEVNWHATMLQSLTAASDGRRDRLDDGRAVLHPVLWVVLLSGGVINVSYIYLFGVRSLMAHLIITTALSTMTTLLLLVILMLDRPFAGSLRVEPEPFVRLLGHLDQVAQQTAEREP